MTDNTDVIFVGNKPPMSYVLAIITSLSQGNLKEITLKARGQAITTAVDVAEITHNRFIKDLKVTKIAIGTAEMPPREGENRSRMFTNHAGAEIQQTICQWDFPHAKLHLIKISSNTEYATISLVKKIENRKASTDKGDDR